MNSPSSSFSSARLALALHDEDLHRGLVVAAGGERSSCGCVGHRRVLRDELLEVAAEGHDAERVRRDVEQDHLAASRRRARRPGSRRRARRPRRGARPCTARARRTRRTACCTVGMRVMPPTRTTSSISSLLELARPRASACRCRRCARRDRRQSSSSVCARERALQVERLVAAARDDERQVDLGLAHARELALGLLGGVLAGAAAPCGPGAGRCRARSWKPVHEPVDDARVEVLAAEERVAGGRDDLEDAVRADLEDRDVERAAAEVVDRDRLLDVLAEAVGERRRGGLVDDADDVEAGDLRRRPWWPGAGCR